MARRRFGREILTPEETRYAHLVPTFETFPGLEARDFEAFAPAKQRDGRSNGERLIVKRKLAALGEAIHDRVSPADLALTMRTSIAHPFRVNGFKVAQMAVYWGRGDKQKAVLKKLLGADLGKDADPAILGVILLVEVDRDRVVCGLKVHPQAWWDGQNLKRRVQRDAASAQAFTDLLNALPAGFALTQSTYKRRYEAGKQRVADIQNFFQYYTPGERWLEVLHETPRAAALAAGAALADPLAERLAALEPLLRLATWSEANNAIL